jgi:hypothetical protein
MNRSGRTPSFEIVRECFIVSPQQRHSIVGLLLNAGSRRSIAGLRAYSTAPAPPLKQAGVLPNSQPPTPGTPPLSVINYM